MCRQAAVKCLDMLLADLDAIKTDVVESRASGGAEGEAGGGGAEGKRACDGAEDDWGMRVELVADLVQHGIVVKGSRTTYQQRGES